MNKEKVILFNKNLNKFDSEIFDDLLIKGIKKEEFEETLKSCSNVIKTINQENKKNLTKNYSILIIFVITTIATLLLILLLTTLLLLFIELNVFIFIIFVLLVAFSHFIFILLFVYFWISNLNKKKHEFVEKIQILINNILDFENIEKYSKVNLNAILKLEHLRMNEHNYFNNIDFYSFTNFYIEFINENSITKEEKNLLEKNSEKVDVINYDSLEKKNIKIDNIESE
jgi:hypothetical protein